MASLVAGTYYGAFRGLAALVINSGISLGVESITKRDSLRSFVPAKVQISAGVVWLSTPITLSTKDYVSKDKKIQKIYEYAVPFIMTACLTSMISTYLNYPNVTWQESVLYGLGAMLSTKILN